MRQKISITLFQFFCNSIKAFKKKIFVNFVSFLLTLECGHGKINGILIFSNSSHISK